MPIRQLKTIQCLLICASMLLMSTAYADFKLPAIDDQYVTLKEVNPTRDAGYVVGDTLTRHISLTINKPYQLVTETLPIVGYQHRYKGQLIGIDLVNINTNESMHTDSTTHDIALTYQIFTTGKLAKPAILRAEFVKIRNTESKEVLQYRIPSWGFRISPLSVFGSVNLIKEMSTFIAPLQLDNSREKSNLKIALGVLAAALLGLLYIFGMRAWLPRMGAPFAKAYREIRKLPDTPEGLQKAVSSMHQSINKTAGMSVFSDTLNDFIALKPQFAPAKAEIEKFFNLSRFTFFEVNGSSNLETHSKDWLLSFCKHLRDCERGLTPHITSNEQG
jgi:mxaA protein